jgi:hypothetical protein
MFDASEPGDVFRKVTRTMVNYFDVNSIEAMANARREQFLNEAEAYRRHRDFRASRRAQAGASPARRAIGFGLIRIGERISGSRVRNVDPAPAA